MANDKISELPAISSVATSDIIPVVDVSAGSTTKATVTQVIAAFPNATGSTAGLMSAADKTKLDTSTSAATNSALVQRDSSGNTAVNSLTAAQVTITGSPTNPTDGTNKAYVDAVAVGLTIKSACRVATTTSVTLSGGAPNVVDGVTVVLNDRVLVKSQSDATQNGIYIVATVGSGSNGTWTRATDADTGAELPTNSYVLVTVGTLYSSTSWVMNTAGTITIGTSSIIWVLFNQITSLPAANITGQIIAGQIADAAITTAKFAAGLTPVEIVTSLPGSGNFEGRTVYLTTDDKLYRYTGSTYISAVASTDITGQITSTQITDLAVTTPKLAAGAVTAAKITAGTITGNEIAANTITSGKIQAAAIGTTELAAGAVTTAKLAAGAVTANEIAANTILAGNIAAGAVTSTKINVSTLSAITANLGTVTAGTIQIGSSINQTNISSSGFSIGSSSQKTVIAGPQIKTYDNSIACVTIDSQSPSGGVGLIQVNNGGFASISLDGSLGNVAAHSITLDYPGVNGSISIYNSGSTLVSLLDISSSGGRLTLKNSGGTGTITLTGSSGNIAATTANLSGLLTGSTATFSGLLTANGQFAINTGGAFYQVTSDGWTPNLYTGDGSTGGTKIQFRFNSGTGNFEVRADGGTAHVF